MASEHLPVYAIDDFMNSPATQGFYMNRLSAHLRTHAFINRPHRHNFYILAFFAQGTGTHTIDFVTYTFSPGAVFFLSPGQVHHWSLSPDVEGSILFFSREFIEGYFAARHVSDYTVFRKGYQYLQLQDSRQMKLLEQLLEQIAGEHDSTAAQHDDVVRDYLDILLIKLSHLHHAAPLPTSTDAGIWQMRELERLIDAHFLEEHAPAYYADRLHLGVKYLNELCRRYFNRTTTQLIQERLILEAKRLLVHDDLSVSQIAAQLHFVDDAYFNRFFRKVTGVTPLAFRREQH